VWVEQKAINLIGTNGFKNWENRSGLLKTGRLELKKQNFKNNKNRKTNLFTIENH
jgi:hypothetical protein